MNCKQFERHAESCEIRSDKLDLWVSLYVENVFFIKLVTY